MTIDFEMYHKYTNGGPKLSADLNLFEGAMYWPDVTFDPMYETLYKEFIEARLKEGISRTKAEVLWYKYAEEQKLATFNGMKTKEIMADEQMADSSQPVNLSLVPYKPFEINFDFINELNNAIYNWDPIRWAFDRQSSLMENPT